MVSVVDVQNISEWLVGQYRVSIGIPTLFIFEMLFRWLRLLAQILVIESKNGHDLYSDRCICSDLSTEAASDRLY